MGGVVSAAKSALRGKRPRYAAGEGQAVGRDAGGGALRPGALSSALASLERAQEQAQSIGEERVGGKHCKGNTLDCASSSGNWS